MKTHQIDDESLIVDPQLEALYTKILEQIGEGPGTRGAYQNTPSCGKSAPIF